MLKCENAVSSFPNYRAIPKYELKAFADDKSVQIQNNRFLVQTLENIARKEEMLVTSIFPLFPK